MAAKILFHPKVDKDLKKLPKNIRERFFKAASQLEVNPLAGIPLKGEFVGSRKVRLGDWRIVYQFSPKTQKVIVYRIESRQGVYNK